MAEYIYNDKNSTGGNDGGNDGRNDNVNNNEDGVRGVSSPEENHTGSGYNAYTGGYNTTPGQSSGPSNYSYNGMNGWPAPQMPPMPPVPQKKKRGNGRMALIAVSVILAAVLLATAAGFGGYYLANRTPVQQTADPQPSNGEAEGSDDGNTAGSVNNPSGVVLTPDSLGTKDKGTISDVVSKVSASVVEITTEYATRNSFYYTQGAGSGVIIDASGYIVTNNHVIYDDEYGIADKITVRLTDGSEYKATVIGTDTESDVAVIKIDAPDLVAATIGESDYLAVGEEVVLIGNPLGSLGGTVTNGIISALDREITVENETMNLLQTNAAVNPGNSGGGMFNLAGELVGIVNAKYSSSGIEGLGFAIPVNDVVSVSNEILDHGYVRGRVSLHINTISIDNYSKMAYYRVNSLGLYVYSAEEGYNDGILENGDRIAQVGDTEITSNADLKSVLRTHEVGDKITMIIVRNGKYKTVELTCYEKLPATDDVEFNDVEQN